MTNLPVAIRILVLGQAAIPLLPGPDHYLVVPGWPGLMEILDMNVTPLRDAAKLPA